MSSDEIKIIRLEFDKDRNLLQIVGEYFSKPTLIPGDCIEIKQNTDNGIHILRRYNLENISYFGNKCYLHIKDPLLSDFHLDARIIKSFGAPEEITIPGLNGYNFSRIAYKTLYTRKITLEFIKSEGETCNYKQIKIEF